MIFPRTSARAYAGPRRLALALAVAASAAGCDFNGDPVVIAPEFDDVSSFETDLGKWAARTLDLGTPPATFEVVRSADRAADGTQSVRLRLDNQAGQGKVLLERRYEVEKDQSYAVDVSFAFASADFASVSPWRLLAGVGPDSPTKTLQVTAPGDTGNGRATDQGFAWATRTFSFQARSDADGELFVYLGVGGTSAGSRTYYLDNVKVTLTRNGITTTP